MTTCNVRDPGGPLRCEHDFNHDGDHGAKVGDKWHTWPNRRDKPTRELGGRTGRRRSMRQVSEPQQIDTDVVTGIMAERVHQEFERFDHFNCECWRLGMSDGRWSDMPCGRVVKGNPQAVLDHWHPHHDEKRRKGPRAHRHNVFRSRSCPDNIFIVAPECHDRIEASQPWPEKTAAR